MHIHFGSSSKSRWLRRYDMPNVSRMAGEEKLVAYAVAPVSSMRFVWLRSQVQLLPVV